MNLHGSIKSACQGLAVAMVVILSAALNPAQAAPIAIENAAAGKSGDTVGIFMKIVNSGGEADQLFAVKTPAAKTAKLFNPHADTSEMEHGGHDSATAIMAVDIQPGASVELSVEGRHIMLMGLAGPVESGQTIPLTLFFTNAGRIQVDVQVR